MQEIVKDKMHNMIIEKMNKIKEHLLFKNKYVPFTLFLQNKKNNNKIKSNSNNKAYTLKDTPQRSITKAYDGVKMKNTESALFFPEKFETYASNFYIYWEKFHEKFQLVFNESSEFPPPLENFKDKNLDQKSSDKFQT